MNHQRLMIPAWIVIGIFLFGMVRLMTLRFSSGDIYPYYSSFRADPLGTKALYESLQLCCNFKVERNHEAFSRIRDRFDSTVLVLGLEYRTLAAVPRSIGDEIHYFISNGGRLVVSLYRPPEGALVTPEIQNDDSKKLTDLTDVWGIRIFEERDAESGAHLAREYESMGLPLTISSHTPLYFQLVSPGWSTIYQRGERPVIAERKLGRGSLVITAESYFFSNQAMVKERHSKLLAWVIGTPATVIFDEYHHGIAMNPGVMYLARRYELEWLLIGLALLALLFVWKNAAPLVPPQQEPVESFQSGKESVAALTNLLRRNVPESQALMVSLAEWQKSAKGVSEENRKEIETIIASEMAKPARQRNLAAAYNAVSHALKQRR
jgi:hypothetical protein